MFNPLHFLVSDFVGEDVGCPVHLQGVSIDDLSVQCFSQIDPELGLPDSCRACGSAMRGKAVGTDDGTESLPCHRCEHPPFSVGKVCRRLMIFR